MMQIQMPSGSNIIVNYFSSQFVNLNVYASSRLRTEGLCGSFDGNPENDVKHRITGATAGLLTRQRHLIDENITESWR